MSQTDAKKRPTKLSSPDSYDSLRQRVLRLPLPPTYKSRQTSSQSQCPIFTIPPEIRRIIWIGCLGGFTMPLRFSAQYCCDMLCSDVDVPGLFRKCSCDPQREEKRKNERGLLHILLACQQVYENHPYLKQVCGTIPDI